MTSSLLISLTKISDNYNNMHINLNKEQNFLQLSPEPQNEAPSPLLSPDPLFFLSHQPQIPIFQLDSPPPPHPLDPLESSPPLPLPEPSPTQKISNKPRGRKRKEKTEKIQREDRKQKGEKEEPLLMPGQQMPPIRAVIELLVQNSGRSEGELVAAGRSVGGEAMEGVVLRLVGKFRGLKKTKEEMTKYCMRKAFKFISQGMREGAQGRDVDTCMRVYFSQASQNGDFSIPFKKNSLDKTMNGTFLKRVFSCPSFPDDYRAFLRELPALIVQDNHRKVLYLEEQVQKALDANDLEKIDNIKRLPWTRDILAQTQALATSLLDFAPIPIDQGWQDKVLQHSDQLGEQWQ